jgi:hypothetical protein
MLDRLARHYGEPVRPVSVYCDAFRAWGKALQDREEEGTQRDRGLDDARAAMRVLMNGIAIGKSSMLGRLIYDGEKLRTEKCPVHKGVWSGIGHCEYGCDHTGWLPAEVES